VDPDSVDVSVDGGILTVKAQRSERTELDVQWLSSERFTGGFMRRLSLGAVTISTGCVVLSSHGEGASINAAAKASGINYRTAQRIVEAAAEHRRRQLLAVG
jgi:hypothetical protein